MSRFLRGAPAQSSPSFSLHPLSASEKLPPEVLGYILSFIPMRPRLLIASRVCKRWRRAALGVPVELSLDPDVVTFSPKGQADAVAHLGPSVRGMWAVPLHRDAHAPPFLQRLRMESVTRNGVLRCYCKAYTEPIVTTLTELDAYTDGACACIPNLIAANSSLTSLSVRFERTQPKAHHYTSLEVLKPLPNLTKLVLGVHSTALRKIFTAFLCNHAQQLMSLSIVDDHHLIIPPPMHFPNLTHCAVTLLFLNCLTPLADRFLDAMPKLQCLDLTIAAFRPDELTPAFIHISPFLRSLTLCASDVGHEHISNAIDMLCVNLTALEAANPLPFASFGSRLQSLSLPYSANVMRELAVCTALRRLKLHNCEVHTFVGAIRLPSLTSVDLKFQRGMRRREEPILAVMRTALRSCPRLRILTCDNTCACVEHWNQLLGEAERIGMEAVVVRREYTTKDPRIRPPRGWLTFSVRPEHTLTIDP